uniref:Uncharacterized protein n=1 Tax=Arundo donax TaxID=35708 RepID=A0A0A9P2U4_ARUDO
MEKRRLNVIRNRTDLKLWDEIENVFETFRNFLSQLARIWMKVELHAFGAPLQAYARSFSVCCFHVRLFVCSGTTLLFPLVWPLVALRKSRILRTQLLFSFSRSDVLTLAVNGDAPMGLGKQY